MSVGFYSLDEAGKRSGKSERELRQLAEEGQLNVIEDDGTLLFSAADVDEIGGTGVAEPSLDLEALDDDDDLVIPPPDQPPSQPDITEVPIALEPEEESVEADGTSKIKSFGGKGISSIQASHDTGHLNRQLHQPERGALRCRTFHAKLNDASLAYLDNQINDWVDNDPTVEIKFATSSVGVVEGKHAEPHLIVTIFY